jgi:hypothetical protein
MLFLESACFSAKYLLLLLWEILPECANDHAHICKWAKKGASAALSGHHIDPHRFKWPVIKVKDDERNRKKRITGIRNKEKNKKNP